MHPKAIHAPDTVHSIKRDRILKSCVICAMKRDDVHWKKMIFMALITNNVCYDAYK